MVSPLEACERQFCRLTRERQGLRVYSEAKQQKRNCVHKGNKSVNKCDQKWRLRIYISSTLTHLALFSHFVHTYFTFVQTFMLKQLRIVHTCFTLVHSLFTLEHNTLYSHLFGGLKVLSKATVRPKRAWPFSHVSTENSVSTRSLRKTVL